MKTLFVFFLLLIAPLTWGQSREYKEMLEKYYDGFPTIVASDARQKIHAKNVYFLDTREKEEYNVSHIDGAVNVGYDHFSMDRVKSIPKNAEIIVYCSIGARSQDIGKKLKKAGYKNVKNLYGGLFHWANMGYTMVNSSGTTERIHGYSASWGKWVTRGKVAY